MSEQKYLEDRWLIVVDRGFACLKTTASLSHTRKKIFKVPLVNCCAVCLPEDDSSAHGSKETTPVVPHSKVHRGYLRQNFFMLIRFSYRYPRNRRRR
jgi:hypothetical protein